MHLKNLLALLPLGCLAQRSPRDRFENVDVVPGRFIVEYAHTDLRKRQDELALRPDVNVLTSFESSVFAGVSVETDGFDAETLESLPDVVRVWPSRLYSLPSFVTGRVVDNIDHETTAATHKVTGVDRLHELGIFGKGAKIGVIDTGIDYNHAAFGGGFGQGARVVGGFDFVGEDYPAGDAAPDEDPMDNLGHGSSVAGIAAGKTANFTGVAPEASLYAYKVIGDGNGVSDEIIIEALLRALDDGVDIVTISLGGPNGWADGSWAEVASRLVDEGIIVTAVAGNDGGTGPFFASTGSSGRNVLSIASADTDPELDTIIKPSNFTSWGGLYDLDLKPDVAAPGRNILSVSISAPDALAVSSGTSMATPYVAGIVALWIGEHGGRSVHGKGFAKKLGQRIISSGESLPWTDADGVRSSRGWRAPPAQVGSGLVDAWKVLQYTTQLDFDKMALNDTRHFKPTHPVSVFNGGDKPATYTFGIENSAGLELLGWLDGWRGRTRRIRNTTQLQPVEMVPKVALPQSFTLGPGESRTVSVRFENPSALGWNASALPVYGGNVVVSSSLGEKLAIPFTGLAADLRGELDHVSEPGYPFHNTGPDVVPWPSPAVFSLNLSFAVQDYPKINNMIIWGSREIRWDIYEPGWTETQWSYPPVPGVGGYIGSAATWADADFMDFDPDAPGADANKTISFPLRHRIRSDLFESYYHWFGKLANGTDIADGRYHARFAVLKPFGSPQVAEDWQVLSAPEIEIRRV